MQFDTLAALVPVYERYRQLSSVFWSLVKLRDNPYFTINPDLKSDLQGLVDAYKAKPQLTKQQRMIDFTHI